MNGSYAPLAVEIMIVESEGDDLEGLAEVASQSEELHVGAVKEFPASQDLFFDLGAVDTIVHSVTAVITGIGGAARVVDWVLTKLRDRRGETILLKSGSTTVTVKIGDDPERARELLQAALHVV